MHSHDDHNEGTLEQVGTVRELYEHPRNMFVADFLNLHSDVAPISFLASETLVPGLAGYTIGVRPEDVAVDAEGGASDAMPAEESVHSFSARVTEVEDDPLAQSRVLTLHVGPDTLVAKVAPSTPGSVGETVRVHLRRYHLFERASGEAVHPEHEVRAALG